MTDPPGWTADSEEVDELLEDLQSQDPEAYRVGQARVTARDRRLELFASFESERGQLSQTIVAARMGTSQSAVARLEGGLTDPKLSTLQRYADAIGRDLQVSLAIRSEDALSIERDRLAAIAASKRLSKPALVAAAALASAVALAVAIAASSQGRDRLIEAGRLLRESVAAQGEDPEEFIDTLGSVLAAAHASSSV